jgi:DNA end-binding protein Ku
VLHTMYFANEIRHVPKFGVVEAVNLKSEEVRLIEQLVKSMTEPFKPRQYHDEFQDKLRKLIEAKQHGLSAGIGDHRKRAPVIDMLSALQKSLSAGSSSTKEKKKENAKAKHAGRSARRAS